MPTQAEHQVIAERRAALQEERRAMLARREAAALKIQTNMRRRLARGRVGYLRSLDRSPLIRAELVKQWKQDRRACWQPGYPVSMLSPSAIERERRRMHRLTRPWEKPQKASGGKPTSPKAEFFLSSLRDAGSSSSSSESAREIAGVPTGVAADDVQ
jgi:hypothetical protein